VLAPGRALLADNACTTVITADVRHPDEVLGYPDLRALVDLDQPVSLLLCAVVHHVNDDGDPAGIVAAYKDAAAPGSYLFVNHVLDNGDETVELETMLLADLGTGRFRAREEIAAFVDGWDLREPGLEYPPVWRRPTPFTDEVTITVRMALAGVATKPRHRRRAAECLARPPVWAASVTVT
jgi:hypothetical protein